MIIFEFIYNFNCITTYLYDVDFKVIPNKFLSGSIMFYFDNEVSLHKDLVSNGIDGFIVDVPNTHYNYCLIDLKINQKVIKAKFDNITDIATKEKKLPH